MQDRYLQGVVDGIVPNLCTIRGMVQHFEKAAGQVLSTAELAVVLLAVFGMVLGMCFKCLDGGASCVP